VEDGVPTGVASAYPDLRARASDAAERVVTAAGIAGNGE
jgi:hypothetical protein